MSCSQNINQLQIRTAAFFVRCIGWLQSGDPKKNKPESELLKAKILTDYFVRKYLAATENLKQKEITVETPETIWQFWDNPTEQATPEIVKSSLKSVIRFKRNFELKVLNKTTFDAYSDLPG